MSARCSLSSMRHSSRAATGALASSNWSSPRPAVSSITRSLGSTFDPKVGLLWSPLERAALSKLLRNFVQGAAAFGDARSLQCLPVSGVAALYRPVAGAAGRRRSACREQSSSPPGNVEELLGGTPNGRRIRCPASTSAPLIMRSAFPTGSRFRRSRSWSSAIRRLSLSSPATPVRDWLAISSPVPGRSSTFRGRISLRAGPVPET